MMQPCAGNSPPLSVRSREVARTQSIMLPGPRTMLPMPHVAHSFMPAKRLAIQIFGSRSVTTTTRELCDGKETPVGARQVGSIGAVDDVRARGRGGQV